MYGSANLSGESISSLFSKQEWLLTFRFVLYKIRIVLLAGRSRDRFPVVSLGNFSVAPDGTMSPGVDSASENEYQGFILR